MKRKKEFREDRFTWQAGDIDPNSVRTNDPEVTKRLRKNMRKALEREEEKPDRRKR